MKTGAAAQPKLATLNRPAAWLLNSKAPSEEFREPIGRRMPKADKIVILMASSVSHFQLSSGEESGGGAGKPSISRLAFRCVRTPCIKYVRLEGCLCRRDH